MPTTTLPTPVEFEKAYKDAIAQGAKEIIMFTVSAAMSGTFQAAKQVADRMGFPSACGRFKRADDESRLAGPRRSARPGSGRQRLRNDRRRRQGPRRNWC